MNTKEFIRTLKNELELKILEALNNNDGTVHKLIETYEKVLEMCRIYQVSEKVNK